MIDVIFAWLVTMLLLVVTAITRPTMARCPTGYYLSEGVRTQPLGREPVGSFACERPPIGGDTDVLTGKNTARSQPGIIRSQIYCTGSLPIVNSDGVTVGCQR